MVIVFFLIFGVSHAATITWTAGSAGNWLNGANWSGGVAPGSGDFVIFSASSTASATINTAVNVSGITITSGYTGTITQNSGKIVTVGSSGWTQSGGAFAGSSAGDTITVNGAYTLAGGIFKSTSGNLELAASSIFSGGAFQNNSGTVAFNSSLATVSGTATFYNLQFGNGAEYSNSVFTIATGTTLTVQGYLYSDTFYSSVQFLGGGQVNAQGNVETMNNPGYATGTAAFFLTGTGTQVVGDNTVNGQSTLILPNLTIQKMAGTVTFVGNIAIMGNFTNSNATAISPGTSTVSIGPTLSFPYDVWGPGIAATISGSSTFNNLIFGADGNGYTFSNSVFTIATGTTLTVQGYLYSDTFYSSVQFLGGGQVNAQGNVETMNNPGYATGTAAFFLTGTGTQVVGDNTVNGQKYPHSPEPHHPENGWHRDLRRQHRHYGQLHEFECYRDQSWYLDREHRSYFVISI